MADDDARADAAGASLMRQARPLIAARLFTAVLTLSIPLVLARVLPLADYGTYKQLFLIALTLSSVLPFGVGQSLYYFIPRTSDRRLYFGQTLLFLLAAGALAAAALYAGMPAVAAAFDNPRLLDHRLLLALYTGLTVSASPLELSMTSQGRTRRSAITYLVWDSARAVAFVVPAAAGRGLGAMMATLTTFAAIRLVAAWIVMLRGTRGPLFDRRLFAEQLAYAVPFGLAMLVAIPQQYAHQYVVASAVAPALFAIYAAGCFDPPFVDLLYTPTGEVLMVRLGALDREGRAGEASRRSARPRATSPATSCRASCSSGRSPPSSWWRRSANASRHRRRSSASGSSPSRSGSSRWTPRCARGTRRDTCSGRTS